MKPRMLPLGISLFLVTACSPGVAQVYSVNAVGYVNLDLCPGFNLIANQLNRTPNNKLDTLLSGVPVESQVFKFSGGLYKADIYDGTMWLDAETGNPSTTTVNPGEGFFFYNAKVPPSTITVTLVGDVPQGDVGLCVPQFFSLVSSKVPQAIGLLPQNGFPNVLEALFLTYDCATQNYRTPLINDGTMWLNAETGDPATPQVAVGEGFFIYNPNSAPMCWTRTFSVN